MWLSEKARGESRGSWRRCVGTGFVWGNGGFRVDDDGQVVCRDLQNGVVTEGVDMLWDGDSFGGSAESAWAWSVYKVG